MPMNSQARAQHMKKLNTGAPPSNVIQAKQFAKSIPRIARDLRSALVRLDRRFQAIDGVDQAAKQTAFFDAISAETDGGLILHDIAQLMDSICLLANDHRQPNEGALTCPFTDADVDAYEAP